MKLKIQFFGMRPIVSDFHGFCSYADVRKEKDQQMRMLNTPFYLLIVYLAWVLLEFFLVMLLRMS